MAILLTDHADGRDNNLNLIRMIAASAVIVSHSFPITRGAGALEPLVALTGRSVGWFAVAIFFCISGFLIARSHERRKSLSMWMAARALRLFPGLVVVLLLTVLVLGPLVTELPVTGYFAALQTWTYVPRNLSLALLQYPLPGVFESNPYGAAINGSLWSLFHEVMCYGGVLLVGTLGLLRRKRAFAIAFLMFLAAYAGVALVGLEHGEGIYVRLGLLMALALPFSLGMAVWVYREHITLDGRLLAAFWILAVTGLWTPISRELLVLAIGYSTLFLAYRPRGAILRYNSVGDYSYGTYIYAFPIQQLMIYWLPGHDWYVNVSLAFPLVLVCAMLSWRYVERPSLALVGSLSQRMITLRAPSRVR